MHFKLLNLSVTAHYNPKGDQILTPFPPNSSQSKSCYWQVTTASCSNQTNSDRNTPRSAWEEMVQGRSTHFNDLPNDHAVPPFFPNKISMITTLGQHCHPPRCNPQKEDTDP